jgi:hypothetical protein
MSSVIQEVRIQTPPAPPAPPRTIDSREINRRIEDAVNQALSQIGDNQQDNAKTSIREAIQDIREQVQEARAEGRAITIQPRGEGITIQPPFENVIPREAVDISIAFFVSMAFIIVGLPIARAFARRMDRRGETASASEIAPRLDRIEQAVEAIAIEVERVSEGQRYTTKSIAELRGLPVPNAGS